MTRWQTIIFLLILWFVCTAINISKPYHIDDTVHLEIAEWVSNNPTRPMSGYLNWSDSPEPIHKLNQPHLYFYLLGYYMKIFGNSEYATHILQSFFTFISIFFFYKLSKYHVHGNNFPILFFVFCPAFIIGQNLMVDIPLISLWLLFYYILSININIFYKYLVASILASVSILIKYISILLIPGLIIAIIIRKDFKYLYFVIVPVLTILSWSLFNYVDYGSFHILDRPTNLLSIDILTETSLSWFVCLGAITPISLMIFSAFIEKYRFRYLDIIYTLIYAIVVLCIISYIFFICDILNESSSDTFLRYTFLVNGVVIILGISYIVIKQFKIYCYSYNDNISGELLLIYWFFSCMLFVILFAPFIATRHLLLVIPPVLILLNKHLLFKASKSLTWITFFMLLSLTILISASDYSYANFYKKNAKLISLRLKDKKIWFSGHWGWQWYAKQNGMYQVNVKNISAIKSGDYLIYPENIHQQVGVFDNLTLDLVYTIEEQKKWWKYISTDGRARFYKSNFFKIPWNYNKASFGPIKIYKIIDITPKN